MVRTGNVAASRGSSPGLDASRGAAALLALAALAPATAVAQRTPQPVFIELFAYDPAAPSQLLEKWRISIHLDRKLQPLRVGVVEEPIDKTVGRVTVQEGDGLDGASEAMSRLRLGYSITSSGRACEVGGIPTGFRQVKWPETRVSGHFICSLFSLRQWNGDGAT